MKIYGRTTIALLNTCLTIPCVAMNAFGGPIKRTASHFDIWGIAFPSLRGRVAAAQTTELLGR